MFYKLQNKIQTQIYVYVCVYAYIYVYVYSISTSTPFCVHALPLPLQQHRHPRSISYLDACPYVSPAVTRRCWSLGARRADGVLGRGA